MRLRLITPLYAGECAQSGCRVTWKPNRGTIGYDPAGPRGLKCYCLACAEKIRTGEMLPNRGQTTLPEPVPESPQTTIPVPLPPLPEPAHEPSALPIETPVAIPVEIPSPMKAAPPSDGKHKQFALLVSILRATDRGRRLNVWIAGPAGSGKTTAASQAAAELELPFAFCGALTQTYTLFGFRDAVGGYRKTPFREIWEYGGVFMLDDFDASDPAVAVELNALLANGHAAFPDGIIPRHPDCAICLSANTWGHGATSDYVGRVKQDGAFLDRFVRLSWDYDEALEAALVPTQPTWAAKVQRIRAAVRAKGLKVLITPRATIQGAALLDAGIPEPQVEQLTIAASMTVEQWKSVCN